MCERLRPDCRIRRPCRPRRWLADPDTARDQAGARSLRGSTHHCECACHVAGDHRRTYRSARPESQTHVRGRRRWRWCTANRLRSVNGDRSPGGGQPSAPAPGIQVYSARERARQGDRDEAIPLMRAAVDHLVRQGQLLQWAIPATGVLVETLPDRGADGDVAEAEAAIERLAATRTDDGLAIRASVSTVPVLGCERGHPEQCCGGGTSDGPARRAGRGPVVDPCSPGQRHVGGADSAAGDRRGRASTTGVGVAAMVKAFGGSRCCWP